jgi:C-methyltransferase C-terminal domain/Putative zinc binding domain
MVELTNSDLAGAALTCRGCAGTRAYLVVDLGEQPASDDFPAIDAPFPDAAWPLQLWYCPDCALVQLGPVEALAEEPVRAVESETSRQHAGRTVAAVLADHPFLVGGMVREFASHHGGSWLEALAGYGCTPAPDGMPADLVVDVHGLAHEQDLAGQLALRASALAPEGLLVIEHHHLLPLVEQAQFDTIRHGHWTYLSLTAVSRLAARHGLRPVRAVGEPVFGGSLRIVLAHQDSAHDADSTVAGVLAAEAGAGLDDGEGLKSLGDRAAQSAAALRAYLTELHESGRTVAGYGAPSKAAILLGVSGVGSDLLPYTVDVSPAKHGLAIPGDRIPIEAVEVLRERRPDTVLILTWDIADEVVTQLETVGWGANYVVPLPSPHAFMPAAVLRSCDQ